jgi:hypothetical protein
VFKFQSHQKKKKNNKKRKLRFSQHNNKGKKRKRKSSRTLHAGLTSEEVLDHPSIHPSIHSLTVRSFPPASQDCGELTIPWASPGCRAQWGVRQQSSLLYLPGGETARVPGNTIASPPREGVSRLPEQKGPDILLRQLI